MRVAFDQVVEALLDLLAAELAPTIKVVTSLIFDHQLRERPLDGLIMHELRPEGALFTLSLHLGHLPQVGEPQLLLGALLLGKLSGNFRHAFT